jgi:hypothetical protein
MSNVHAFNRIGKVWYTTGHEGPPDGGSAAIMGAVRQQPFRKSYVPRCHGTGISQTFAELFEMGVLIGG